MNREADAVERLADLALQRLDGRFETYFEQLDERDAILQDNIEAMFNKHLGPIKSDIADLKQDMHIVKTAVTATNHDLRMLEQRAGRLEASA